MKVAQMNILASSPLLSDDQRVGRRRRARRRKWDGSGVTCTPLMQWKFVDGEGAGDFAPSRGKRWPRRATGAVSARKLASGLWRMAAVNSSGGVRRRRFGLFHRLGFDFHSSLAIPIFSMEGATKWDPGYLGESNKVPHFDGNMKFTGNQGTATISVASAWQDEMAKARKRIKELEAERRLSKMKLKRLMMKLNEERVLWMRRQRVKMGAIVDELINEVRRERRNRQKMDIVNKKLIDDLSSAKLSARRLSCDYKRERKACEILQEVCNELARKIEEDNDEIEALTADCRRIREEVEEERKMLQIAEVWREEQVQMKLVEAKLILEEKYTQMENLIADLEIFVKSRDVALDVIEMGKVKELQEAVESIDIQDMEEGLFRTTRSDDTYRILEDQLASDIEKREIDHQSVGGGSSPATRASPFHRIGLTNDISRETGYSHSSGFTSLVRGCSEDPICEETVTHIEDQSLSHTPCGSEHSVNKLNRGKPGPIVDQAQKSESSDISSIFTNQSMNKTSSVQKICRTLISNNEACKKIDGNRRLSVVSSPNKSPVFRQRVILEEEHLDDQIMAGQACSPERKNPHIIRAMKGCIEWPRGIQRHSSKAKMLEARLETQKMQIRSILKQKS